MRFAERILSKYFPVCPDFLAGLFVVSVFPTAFYDFIFHFIQNIFLFFAHGQAQNICFPLCEIGVSEKTMSKWVNEGKWHDLRKRLLLAKEEQINMLYEQLENLNIAIKATDKKHADSKQADILIKITASIRNMETDLAIADLIESGIRFIKYMQQVGTTQQVMDIADNWNSFIQASIKK